jgi:hypothetical protein
MAAPIGEFYPASEPIPWRWLAGSHDAPFSFTLLHCSTATRSAFFQV